MGSCISVGLGLGTRLCVRSSWLGDGCPSHLLSRAGGQCLSESVTPLLHLQQWLEVQSKLWTWRDHPAPLGGTAGGKETSHPRVSLPAVGCWWGAGWGVTCF